MKATAKQLEGLLAQIEAVIATDEALTNGPYAALTVTQARQLIEMRENVDLQLAWIRFDEAQDREAIAAYWEGQDGTDFAGFGATFQDGFDA